MRLRRKIRRQTAAELPRRCRDTLESEPIQHHNNKSSDDTVCVSPGL